MTRADLPAQAANVLRAVGSTSTCTSTQVESLKLLLLPANSSIAKKSTERATVRQKNRKPVAATSKPANPRAKQRAVISVHECVDENHDTLELQSKLILATEIINVTLKTLTIAVKAPQASQTPRPKRRSLARSSSSTSFSDAVLPSRCQTPLQSISVNKVLNSPAKIQEYKRNSSSPLPGFNGSRLQAKCARVGLACLRYLQTLEDFKAKFAPLQIETAMSALIAKLLALGFDDLALKELRILKRRIETLVSGQSRVSVKSTYNAASISKGEDSSHSNESLASLLKYTVASYSVPVLPLIVTSQIQALKLLALKGNGSSIEAALEHLRIAVAYGPAHLIESQISPKDQKTKTSAARQLEILAQTLLRLCPNASKAAVDNLKAETIVSAQAAFEIQSLALQIRLRWWELSDHRPNLETEIVRPLSRCLRAFQRRCESESNIKYGVARDNCKFIIAALEKRGDNKQDFTSIFKILMEMATESRLDEEAIKWIKFGLENIEAFGGSPSYRCTLLCHLAAIRIRGAQHCLDNDFVVRGLQDAAASLAGDLRGDSSELDELLVVVASLRRVVFRIVQDNVKKFTPSDVNCDEPGLGEYTRFILLSIRFLVRYVGSEPSQDTNESKLLRYKDRKKMAAQIAPSMIESIVTISKLSVKSDMTVWQIFDARLRDSLDIAKILDPESLTFNECSKGSTRCSHFYVSISQAYWFRFLALKSMETEQNLLAKPLQTSIDILANRSNEEKVAGCLLTKLERYSILCENSQDYQRASRCYEEAIRFSIDSGIVHKLAIAARLTPWPSVVGESHDFQQFSRYLYALPKAALKIKDSPVGTRIFFDREWLPSDQRVLLLEQQLSSITAASFSQNGYSIDNESLKILVTTLITLYNTDGFPIQRLHTCVRLLQLLLVHPNLLEDGLVSTLLDESNKQSARTAEGLDEALQPYSAHLRSCLNAYLRLRNNKSNARDLETIIADWCRLLQQSPVQKSLAEHVYDVQGWLQQLELISSYIKVLGNERLRMALLHLTVSIHEGISTTQHLDLAAKVMDLGTQYARLGYSGQGGATLLDAQHLLEVSAVPKKLVVKALLAKAEYRLLNGNLDTCRESLKLAKEALQNEPASHRQSAKDRTAFAQAAADLMLIQSKFSTEKGWQDEALFFARACVQETQRIWAAIGRHITTRKTRSPVEDVKNRLVEATSELSISTIEANSATHSRYADLDNFSYWELSPRLFEAFLILSQCFAHNGLLLEAQYYLMQCQRIADAVHSPSMKHTFLIFQGQYAICKGDVEEGLATLQTVQQILSGLPPDHNNIKMHTYIALSYVRIGQIETGRALCSKAMHLLRNLTTKTALDRLIHKSQVEESLALQMRDMTLQETKQISIKKSRLCQKRAPVKSRVQPRVVALSPAEVFLASDIVPLNTLRNEILRISALADLSQDALDAAASQLDDATVLPHQVQSVTLHGLLSSKINLRRGLQQLVADPIFGILPESSICCPATIVQNDSKSPVQSPIKPSKSSRIVQSKVSSKNTMLKDKSVTEMYSQYISVAQQCLNEVFKMAMTCSSTSDVHTISKTLGDLLIIFSALPSVQTEGFSPCRFIAYILELGRQVAMKRELLSINVEHQLSQRLDPDLLPHYESMEDKIKWQQGRSLDFSDFQGEYIDIIPRTWQVLSMTLSESHEEIWISKIRTGQSPFILRLPFNRENTSDGDDEIFGFNEGRSEMLDIVEMANTSAQSGRDMSGKGAKTKWWDNRARLDTRLKDLLTNIESIWFGGFRGIFSTNVPEPQLLARFQQSLQNILDKHLPSRQLPCKTKQINRVTLDSRILELFVGLGPPGENNDLDEHLMDLLYFIVDILQFNKERNAYDEIDFDAIVIETVDALHHYHQAVSASESYTGKKHTILVLDKHLHGFPWESLPPMVGQSVSRLPSLSCLRRRILQMGKDQDEKASSEELEGIRINPDHGAYVLNPGGDLKNTQAVFEEPLQRLSNWKGYTGREPSEADMKSCIRDNELFLYFGHGSGKQYMRPRTVKKLEQCAVALLMGCSSGALTEAGEYEAYGTPIDYMHAGCPALLATLWDVTDKDIDRFSKEVLRKWGLIRERASISTTSPSKKSAKRQGKMKVTETDAIVESYGSSLSLNEAVTMSRDSCFLRYLNGAAPVVYGVPVYLS